MDTKYTSEKNTLMLIYLMKKHGIKKMVLSPGTTNICLSASVQQDNYFELYSCVDERSAAYMACGLAAESGEPVALSCTGATASRNYMSALTEAYYRKLPILAITSTQHTGRVGNHIAQVIDRSTPPNDIVNMSIQVPSIHDYEDEWAYNVMINKALLELRHRGGGPVHINLTTTYSKDYTTAQLPEFRVIRRYEYGDSLPDIKAEKVGVYVGAHPRMSNELVSAINSFCESYNGVVFCDHTSNYHGPFRVNPALVCNQAQATSPCEYVDLVIHIGEISGSGMALRMKESWRVNPDGEVRDTFRVLKNVFEMREIDFFNSYVEKARSITKKKNTSYLTEWRETNSRVLELVPELPFGNAWVAQHSVDRFPEGCVVHLGILNSLRNWDFFEFSHPIDCYCNTGGFGIDGCVSSLIGASFNDKKKLYFGIVGDLAFFYDMNVWGNRHLGNNVRLMVINNGKGTEFRNFNHDGARFGDNADNYIAAAGHFGNKSSELVRHYAEDLGCEYLTASTKEEFINQINRFLTKEMLDKPIIFEVFTESKDESDALYTLYNMDKSASGSAKMIAKGILGENGYNTLKRIVKG